MRTSSFKTAKYYNAGGALSNENDPNTTAPAADRVVDVPSGFAQTNGLYLISAFGGTSATLRVWMFDTTQNKWLSTHGALVTLAAGQGIVGSSGSTEKKMFVQLVANTGLTELYYGIL